MTQVILSAVDKIRLGELVAVYLNPSEKFNINNKGEVSLLKDKTFLEKLFRVENEKLDFMEICQVVGDKIMSEKGEIPFVKQNCRNAIVVDLLENNNRKAAIEKLYIAHLVTEQPRQQERQQHQGQNPRAVEISVRTEERVVPVHVGRNNMQFERQPSNYELSQQVCELLNRASKVIVVNPG